MHLSAIMTKFVKTVTFDSPAEDAYHTMNLHDVHHLVVVRGKDVVGVLSQRDLGGKFGSEATTGRTVAEFMTPDIVTATVDTTVQEAAQMMRGYSIGCLPIMDGDELVGVVTTSDLLELIARNEAKI